MYQTSWIKFRSDLPTPKQERTTYKYMSANTQFFHVQPNNVLTLQTDVINACTTDSMQDNHPRLQSQLAFEGNPT